MPVTILEDGVDGYIAARLLTASGWIHCAGRRLRRQRTDQAIQGGQRGPVAGGPKGSFVAWGESSFREPISPRWRSHDISNVQPRALAVRQHHRREVLVLRVFLRFRSNPSCKSKSVSEVDTSQNGLAGL